MIRTAWIAILLLTGTAVAQQNITLSTGFTPDPYLISGTASGQDWAADFFPADRDRNACVGRIDYRNPTAYLTVTRGALDLVIRVQGDFDSTLIIRKLDNNRLYCNDDFKGQLEAGIDDHFPAGQYAIYVGAISDRSRDFRLRIHEKGHNNRPERPQDRQTPTSVGNRDTDPDPNVVASRIFCHALGNDASCGYFAVYDGQRDLAEISITLPNGNLAVFQFDFTRHAFFTVGTGDLEAHYDGAGTYFLYSGANSFTVPRTLIPGFF